MRGFNMKHISVAIFLMACAMGTPAEAGSARVVSSCGGAQPAGSNFVGSIVDPTIDTNGLLCSSATSSGGASAVTQSGTWTVQPGNTANTTAWKVDGSAVTQPVSVSTLPSLAAGSAIIGKFGIDQTTPGTTNGVQVNLMADVTASGSITTQNLTPTVGATAGSAVTIVTTGLSTLNIQVTGTYTGALSLQGTVDGTNWITLSTGAIFYNKNSGADGTTITSAAVGIFSTQASGYAQMRVTGLAAMTGTAVVTIDGSIAPSQTAQAIQGTGADAAAIQGNPVLIGGGVLTTTGVAITSGTTIRAAMSSGRQLITIPYAPTETTWQHAAVAGGIVNSTTAETLQAAGAANVRNYLVSLEICVSGTVTASELVVRDGAAGTVIWRGGAPAATIGCIPLINFNPPLKGTAATLMEFATLTGMGASSAVYVNAQGYQGP